MLSALIDDGYTLTTKLEQVGCLAAPTIRYRPALAEEVMEYIYQRDLVHGRNQIKSMTEFAVKHLVGWDIAGADGQIVAANVENLRRLSFGYLLQVVDCIMGYAKSQAEADLKNSVSASA